MSDQPSQPEKQPNRPRINVQVNDDIKHGIYANFLVTSHGPHEFTLDFCQLMPGGQPDKVNAEVVARVRIAPTMVAKVIQALNTNLTNYEEKFGQVKAIG